MQLHTTLHLLLFCLLIPYPSKQHFVWPLHWCLLADICNHTWIPECGAEDEIPTNRKLFIDECDMYEYNCDYERDFEPINYSDCFNLPIKECPVPPPCPSIPPCPDHKLHKKGNRYKFVKTPPSDSLRRWGFKRTTLTSLPRHMLRGRRRYTPWHTRNMRRRVSKTKATFTTVVLKREEVIKNGKRMMKVIKKIFRTVTKKNFTEDQDFLE
ncbi:uncharacterized protein LOC123711088 [Pieris brassicae]|uniref:uncharacterized protein LOC123711088 n=1 Tax=Pieris brassicae TaxID=7116 RepID=UPI001E65F4C6|nr:uncharacterized protein LOC123711088 [Pieris brassicae]